VSLRHPPPVSVRLTVHLQSNWRSSDGLITRNDLERAGTALEKLQNAHRGPAYRNWHCVGHATTLISSLPMEPGIVLEKQRSLPTPCPQKSSPGKNNVCLPTTGHRPRPLLCLPVNHRISSQSAVTPGSRACARPLSGKLSPGAHHCDPTHLRLSSS